MELIYVSTGSEITSKEECFGTEKKIVYQINALRKNGVNVTHLCSHRFSRNRYLNYFCISFYRPIKYYLQRKHLLDKSFVYIRREYHHISYLPLILRPRKYKVIIETQCIEPYEYIVRYDSHNIFEILLQYKVHYMMLLFEKYLKNNVDAVVSVTNEISDYNKTITDNKLKYMTMGNGIDTAYIHVRSQLPILSNTYQILCVAGVSSWHGIDRFIYGLHEYTGNKKIILRIVGEGPALPNLKSLTKELKLEDHVTFHGFKSGADLDAMFDMCHIAIGSLAGFRANLNELSSLKSREYCARGIPFIMASKDADFPENWDYVQMVPANETPIDMDTVVAFADRVMSDTEHPQKMRRYAEEHLDWLAKMKTLKEFLESL